MFLHPKTFFAANQLPIRLRHLFAGSMTTSAQQKRETENKSKKQMTNHNVQMCKFPMCKCGITIKRNSQVAIAPNLTFAPKSNLFFICTSAHL